MNMVILTGRLTADPVISQYEGFSRIDFTLAIDRDYVKKDGTRDTDFIPCRTIDNTPDMKKVTFYSKFIKKGMPITIIGNWRIDVYDNKDGIRVWNNYCNIDKLKFCPTNAPKDNSQLNTQYRQNTQQYQNTLKESTPSQYQDTNITQQQHYYNNSSNTSVIAGKKSSWQKDIVEEPKPQYTQSQAIYQQPIQNSNPITQESNHNENTIPQAFDIGIDMSDEFLF